MAEHDADVQGEPPDVLTTLGGPALLAALDDIPAAVIVVDADRTVLYWNKQAEDLYGWPASDAVGRHLTDLIVDPTLPRLVTPDVQEALRRGKRFLREYEARRRDGSMVPITTGFSGLIGADGELLGIIGVSLDRSAQKAAEARNRRLAAIIDATPDFVGLCRPDGSVVSINEAGRRLLDLADDDVTSLNVADFLSPAVQQRLREEIIPHAVRHGAWSGQAMFGWEGREIPVSQVVLTHRNLQGKVSYISTIARDISDALRTERALSQREAQASLLAELSQQALAITDLPALFDAAAHGIAEVLGIEIAGIAERLPDGESFVLRGGAGLPPEAVDNLVVPSTVDGPSQRAMRTGRPSVFSTADLDPVQTRWFIETYGGRSGVISGIGTTERPYGMLAVFSTREDGVGVEAADFVQAVAGVLGNAIERRRTEVDLHRAQRLKALGRFAGGIAHDFNNLLAVILGNLEVIGNQNTQPSVVAAVEDATRAGQQAAALVDQLVSFSRGRDSAAEAVDVNEVLQGIRAAVVEQSTGDVDVSFELTAGPLLVLAHERRLRQAIRHLIENGLEAMPQQGTLTVRSHAVEASAAQARGMSSQPFVCIAISDTGPGMDEQTAAQVFEPYFTTKQPADGRGLGLPSTYGIVTEAGGMIDVDSQPGRGTTMTLWWPSATQELVAAPQAAVEYEAGPEKPSHPTLLLVEDQAAIRSLLTSVLGDRGYTVIEAINGAEALELVRSHPGRIDVVVTDVVMPQMSGPEMVAKLRQTDPALAVLYVSGFHQDSVEDSNEGPPTAFLRKPFGIAQLVSTVSELVERAGVSPPQR